jgi:hypothetical protein
MSSESSSKDASAGDIRKALALKAGDNGLVSANVFFQATISADALGAAAQTAIDQTAKRLGRSASDVSIGRIHRLAKSVSVDGDPEFIAELSNTDDVKTILASEIDDIYPKPVKKRVVE